jgi:N-terminal domain of reverse transcriptase
MDASDCDVASTNWTHWHGIPWQDANQVVGRLQARIAKAAKAGEWRNVNRLQRLLTRSISAKALAVKRVTENQGRKTPGIDRQTWSTPDDKWQAVGTLHHKGLQAEADETGLHPESKWRPTPSGHPDHRRPGHASAALVGARSDSRDDRRHSLLRLPPWALNGRCNRTGAQCDWTKALTEMGAELPQDAPHQNRRQPKSVQPGRTRTTSTRASRARWSRT